MTKSPSAMRSGFFHLFHTHMSDSQLDRIDLRLLALLQRDNRRMLRCPEVLQCWELAGEVDYLITVVTRGMSELSEFTRKHLADDKSVRSYRTMIVLRQTKNAPLPIAS